MNITDIQRMMNKVICPECQKATIDVSLRCDLGYGECLATATCRTCQTLYEVSTEKEVLEAGQKGIGPQDCPDCDEKDLKVQFRCELPSRRCFYVAYCPPCDKPLMRGGSVTGAASPDKK